MLGDIVHVGSATRSSPNLQVTRAVIPKLILDSALAACKKVKPQLDQMKLTEGETVADGLVQVDLVASGLQIPDIRMQSDGQLVVGDVMLPLQPSGATFLVDGVLSSLSSSGELKVSPGIHRLRIEHPMFEPIEQVVNVIGNGQQFTFAMTLSDAGRAAWAKNIAIIESMKNGEVLRQNQVEMVKAFAQFLSNSRINLDTSEVRNLNLGEGSYWWQILGE